MSNDKIEAMEDLLDDAAQSFDAITKDLRTRSREARRTKAITREEFDDIRADCDAMSRRAMELTAAASRKRLARLAPDIEAFEHIVAELTKAKKRIDAIEARIEVAASALSAVTNILSAVTSPSAASIAKAASSVTKLVATTDG